MYPVLVELGPLRAAQVVSLLVLLGVGALLWPRQLWGGERRK